MGAGESSNPIRNMDKRTARREYRDDFARGIQHFRTVQKYRDNLEGAALEEIPDPEWGDGDIKVFVRKRPIFKRELDLGEFDVVTCTDRSTVVVHDARMHTDMKRQFINHHKFKFDRVFDDKIDNLSVYSVTTAPLVQIAAEGGYSTCFVYGQTGSGKTFTMSSIYEQAVYELFVHLETKAADMESTVIPQVSVSFFEIAGDDCHDLLNSFAACQLLAGSDGSFHAFPVVEVNVSGPEELMAMINHGRNVRATAATGVHDASSRSHALLRIFVHLDNLGADRIPSNLYLDAFRNFNEGTLTLVDLAGSEHRIDSMYHSADRRKEGAAINASLMALKECIRARALRTGMTHQYRKSRLTMALKQSFELSSARTVVISCVSPASKDTEHSLNTLRHACIMDGQDASAKTGETRFITGGEVETVQIGEVNIQGISKKVREAKKAGDDVGVKASNGNVFRENEREMTEAEKESQRRIAEKKSIASMAPKHRKLLKESRTQIANNNRQTFRMRRPADGNLVSVAEEVAAVAKELSVAVSVSARPRSAGESMSQRPSSASARSGPSGGSKKSGAALEISTGDDGAFGEGETPKKEKKKKPTEKSKAEYKRPTYDELFFSVYGEDGMTGEPARRRQLTTLMRMNGYSENEIKSMAPPSPTDVLLHKAVSKKGGSPSPSAKSRRSGRSSDAHSVEKCEDSTEGLENPRVGSAARGRERDGSRNGRSNREKETSSFSRFDSGNDNNEDDGDGYGNAGRLVHSESVGAMSKKSSRGSTGSAGTRNSDVHYSPEVSSIAAAAAATAVVQAEADTRQARQTAAKERRLKAEEEKRQALTAKIVSKHGESAMASHASASSNRTASIAHREQEIAKLEDMLFNCEDLSAAAIFAINKQIAGHRAAVVKEQRMQQEEGIDESQGSVSSDHRGSSAGAGAGAGVSSQEQFSSPISSPREAILRGSSSPRVAIGGGGGGAVSPRGGSSGGGFDEVPVGQASRKPSRLKELSKQATQEEPEPELPPQREPQPAPVKTGGRLLARKVAPAKKPIKEWQSVVEEPLPQSPDKKQLQSHAGAQAQSEPVDEGYARPPAVGSHAYGGRQDSGDFELNGDSEYIPSFVTHEQEQLAQERDRNAFFRPNPVPASRALQHTRPATTEAIIEPSAMQQHQQPYRQPYQPQPQHHHYQPQHPPAQHQMQYQQQQPPQHHHQQQQQNMYYQQHQQHPGHQDHYQDPRSQAQHRPAPQPLAHFELQYPPQDRGPDRGAAFQPGYGAPPQQQQQQPYYQPSAQAAAPPLAQVPQPIMYYGRRRAPGSNVGAAAAPFANDFSWDS